MSLRISRPPRSPLVSSSAASDVYKRQERGQNSSLHPNHRGQRERDWRFRRGRLARYLLRVRAELFGGRRFRFGRGLVRHVFVVPGKYSQSPRSASAIGPITLAVYSYTSRPTYTFFFTIRATSPFASTKTSSNPSPTWTTRRRSC